MALDLSRFKKSTSDTTAKVPVVENLFVQKPKVVITTPKQKPGLRYFHCNRPNIGVHVSAKLRIQFKGNYFETADAVVAEYLIAHYSKLITEITEEQKLDGNTIKE